MSPAALLRSAERVTELDAGPLAYLPAEPLPVEPVVEPRVRVRFARGRIHAKLSIQAQPDLPVVTGAELDRLVAFTALACAEEEANALDFDPDHEGRG
jgi:hypothetical protein